MSCSTPLVSIVIPMHNAAADIAGAIESVLAQSMSDFELICVDDGSSDRTLEVVCGYVDRRILLVQQEQRGLTSARNTGIALARGRFVALLNAADRWHERKLAKHVSYLAINPNIGCSYSASILWDHDGVELAFEPVQCSTIVNAKDVFCRNPVGNWSSPVLRKAALESVAFWRDGRKMYFDETLSHAQDIECWTRMCLDTQWGFAGIAEVLNHCRAELDTGSIFSERRHIDGWKQAMLNLRTRHVGFFVRYYPLALAYQYRSVARQAIRLGRGLRAWKYLCRAVVTSPIIVIEEPNYSLNTLIHSCLAMLPHSVYLMMERSMFKTRAVRQ